MDRARANSAIRKIYSNPVIARMDYHINGSYASLPAVMQGGANDIDVVVLWGEGTPIPDTWVLCGGSEYGDSEFTAYRDGDINYIVVTDPVVYDRWWVALNVVRKLGITTKEQRVEWYEFILELEA